MNSILWWRITPLLFSAIAGISGQLYIFGLLNGLLKARYRGFSCVPVLLAFTCTFSASLRTKTRTMGVEEGSQMDLYFLTGCVAVALVIGAIIIKKIESRH